MLTTRGWVSAVYILLPGLLLMGLHSKAAESLSKVHHRQNAPPSFRTYRRFILSTLSWNIVKDQKTGLINFRRTWRFRTKLLSLGKKTRPVCHQLSGPFHMVMPVCSPHSYLKGAHWFLMFPSSLYFISKTSPMTPFKTCHLCIGLTKSSFRIFCKCWEIWKKFLANQVY